MTPNSKGSPNRRNRTLANCGKKIKLAADARSDEAVREKNKFALAEGVPSIETATEAYKYVLSPHCDLGLNTPDDVRRYFADVVKRVGNRLNPAHLYLASLIAERPRMFGTVFTTNFDPLLQRALQLVSVPYFVSDRPDTMEHADDDDVVEALHVVHAHGSIYRYLLLNAPEKIEEYAVRNQSLLQDYFRKHTVLIVGYSGWDDAITRALANVTQFDHNLYWCDRGQSPDKSGLSGDARKILQKHSNAFYLPIESADKLMVELHQRLVRHILPRIFREPIGVMRSQLERCDLNDVTVARTDSDSKGNEAGGERAGSPGTSDELNLGQEVETIKNRLEDAEKRFKGEPGVDEGANTRALVAARARERLAVATDQYFSKHYAEAIPHLDFVVKHGEMLDASERALGRLRRGFAYNQRGQEGDFECALADYTAVIEMPEAPAKLRARARVNRGVAYGKRGKAGDVERALADCTAVIDMPDAPAEQHARARYIRGFTHGLRGQKGDVDREIADYTAVIDMPDASAKQRANARYSRGLTYGQRGQKGDVDREIADYTAVIDMPDVSAEQRAGARYSRAITYGQRGQEGDVDREIADYTAVIDMPGASAEQRANARYNRGLTYGQRGQEGDVDLQIADYTAVIDMPDAPAEQRAKALKLRNRLNAA